MRSDPRAATAAALLATLACIAAPLAAPLAAQQEPAPIQDNSFLVEEAYNQEDGVVQHVNTFSRPDGGGAWGYSLSQEWPVAGLRHQVSYTVPVLQEDGAGTGIGDIGLSYRYQLAGDPDADFLAAPRVTLLLPTGKESRGRGAGEFGVQTGLAVSRVVAPKLMAHANAGFTAVRRAETAFNLGASAVWLFHPAFNFLLEGIWLTDAAGESAFVNPGLRGAFDLVEGLQVVPGLAYTVGVGPSSGDDAVFVYLSFEHAFKRR